MITPQLATQEVPVGSPPPLPRDGEVQERLEDRWGGLAVVIGASFIASSGAAGRAMWPTLWPPRRQASFDVPSSSFSIRFCSSTRGPTPEGSLSAQRAA
jgi:hypothetical protein